MKTLRLPRERLQLYPPASAESLAWLSQQFRGFDLGEYLELLAQSNGVGEVFEQGAHREVHNMLVFSAEESLQVSQNEFDGTALAIGRPGVDGIVFVLQPSTRAVYAYFPIDEEYREVASSLEEFLNKWSANDLPL